MKTLYTATATANEEGRQGHAWTSDGMLDLRLCPPKELGGPGGATNPEQLFALGFAACFSNAMRLSAMREGREDDIEGATVTTNVHIGALGKGRFGLAAEIEVDIPKLDQQAAEALAEKAHERCPYSNATRGSMDVKLTVRGGEGGAVGGEPAAATA